MSEVWKTVFGFPYYSVSNRGRVKSRDRYIPHWRGGWRLVKGRILSPTVRRGYLTVGLCDGSGKVKIQNVHCLMLRAFVGECPIGMMGCHWDDNRGNNTLKNLRWATPKQNTHDALRNGRLVRGELHHSAKLNRNQVVQIRKDRNSGQLLREISKKFGVTIPSVARVLKGTSWKSV